MLATMLEKLLCPTFRSPNQRISQGWEGKKPASAGFLLAAVLASYAIDTINKSYQLGNTMKINEIALNENVWTDAAKLAGKTLPRIERLPGETMIDAIKRAKSELGGVKSADNLVSPEELSALRKDPVPPSSGPAVWSRRGDPNFDYMSSALEPTSGYVRPRVLEPIGSGPSDPAVWRRRPPSDPVALPQRNPTNGPAAMNLQAAERMRQANAEKRAAAAPAAKPPEAPTPKSAEAPGGLKEPSMGSAAAPAGDDGIKFTKAEILDMMKRQAAETPSINIGTDAAKKSSFPWKTAATAAIAGPEAYNLATPKDWPKLPDSVAHWPYNAAGTVWQNFKDNSGVPTVNSVTPADTTASPSEITPPPSADAVDTAIKNDPANQEVSQEIEKWNREHPNNPIKESHTNELTRIVFLSRP